MVERKRRQDIIPFADRLAGKAQQLLGIEDQIGMRQHRALADAGRAARILQHRDGRWLESRRCSRRRRAGSASAACAAPFAQRRREALMREAGAAGSPCAHGSARARSGRAEGPERARPRWSAPHAAPGQASSPSASLPANMSMMTSGRDLGIGIELGHLLRGIERVDVDEDAARLEDAEGDDGIGEAVRDLHGDAVSGRERQLLAQIGREGVRQAIDLARR